MLEIGTSGSVGGEGGNVLAYPATLPAMPRETAQAAPNREAEVRMRRRGADCSVIAMKRGNARGAKGAGHRHRIGPTGNRRSLIIKWKAAAFMRWHEPDESRGSCPDL
jgi:hypothetical protein